MRKVMASPSKKKKHTSASKKHGTVAFSMKHKDGTGLVGIGNLNVVLLKEDGAWFAQGLEIDYLVQGTTMADVKKKFQKGLCESLHENLKKHGTIKPFLKMAPTDVWDELFYNTAAKLRTLSAVSIGPGRGAPVEEQLPLRQINFIGEARLAA
jgi:hypothetical protein